MEYRLPTSLKVYYADNACTAMNSASTKVHSGVRKETCWLSIGWTKAW